MGSAKKMVNSVGMYFAQLPCEMILNSNASDSCYLGCSAVGQSEYHHVVGENPSLVQNEFSPVNSVSWFDAVEFCRRLSSCTAEAAAGWNYRLPREGEWEAGVAVGIIKAEFAQHMGNSRLHPSKKNEIAMEDSGNAELFASKQSVWEWCQDWDGLSGHGKEPGEEQLSRRAVRGASWLYPTELFPFPSRLTVHPSDRSVDIGFRVVAEKIN